MFTHHEFTISLFFTETVRSLMHPKKTKVNYFR